SGPGRTSSTSSATRSPRSPRSSGTEAGTAVRYSGSPLAYSFSEADHRKTSWLVELDGTGAVHAERVDAPVPRALARIRGPLERLLDDPALARHEESWVEATLTDAARPHEPMARLVKRYPHILSLVFDPDEGPARSLASYAQRLRGRSDQEIAEDFVEHVRSGRAADERERAELRSAIDEVRAEDMTAEVAR
ncbi:exonuclease SbcCD subunit D C-terminal domain-containing protein, partial [Streptomyces lydicus]|uniref:exonuclease SbcCD subunit D C-terminal domain-containing protein n=1 Tax=Streptomyces lydicus TaxID=47763 RepID=UPI00332D3218